MVPLFLVCALYSYNWLFTCMGVTESRTCLYIIYIDEPSKILTRKLKETQHVISFITYILPLAFLSICLDSDCFFFTFL